MLPWGSCQPSWTSAGPNPGDTTQAKAQTSALFNTHADINPALFHLNQIHPLPFISQSLHLDWWRRPKALCQGPWKRLSAARDTLNTRHLVNADSRSSPLCWFMPFSLLSRKGSGPVSSVTSDAPQPSSSISKHHKSTAALAESQLINTQSLKLFLIPEGLPLPRLNDNTSLCCLWIFEGFYTEVWAGFIYRIIHPNRLMKFIPLTYIVKEMVG